jgi:hypothetical protein
MTVDAAGQPATQSSRIPSAGFPEIVFVDDADAPVQADPGTVVLTCANCGAMMDERKCKLICRCGYFLSCSDYY